jgi:hypothetical protein
MTTPKIQSPRVSAVFSKRLMELNLTRSDFIRKFQKEHQKSGSRNHLFKILNGQVIAGERRLLPMIAKTMGLDYDNLVQMVRADKIQSKNWASAVPKANKTQQEVLTIMETLSKRDQEDILLFARAKANR